MKINFNRYEDGRISPDIESRHRYPTIFYESLLYELASSINVHCNKDLSAISELSAKILNYPLSEKGVYTVGMKMYMRILRTQQNLENGKNDECRLLAGSFMLLTEKISLWLVLLIYY